MQSLNIRVIQQVCDWLESGETVWLGTVVRTYGSSPRPPGSLMAFAPSQGVVGSLSGGCIEEDLFAQLAADQQQGFPANDANLWLLRYGVSEEEQARFALPCGGQLHVLLEKLRPECALDRAHFKGLSASLMEQKPVQRRLCLTTGERSILKGEVRNNPLTLQDDLLIQGLSPAFRLLVVGAGEVSRYVAEFAASLDFQVNYCDPRQEYLDKYPIPGVATHCALPDDLIAAQFSGAYNAIVALSHDPRVDDMALMQALQTEAFFVGAMGSVETSRKRRERLSALGVNKAQLARLRAPIGLDIGSKTPAEIALSVLAEVVAVRNRKNRAIDDGQPRRQPIRLPLVAAR